MMGSIPGVTPGVLLGPGRVRKEGVSAQSKGKRASVSLSLFFFFFWAQGCFRGMIRMEMVKLTVLDEMEPVRQIALIRRKEEATS